MKKILLLILTFIFLNCTKSDSTKNDLISLGIKGDVESMIELSYPKLSKKWDNKDFEYLFDKNGFAKKKINYSNSSYTLFDYDNSGKIKESKMYELSSDKLIYISHFEYNKSGKVSTIKIIDSLKENARTRSFEYSSNNKIIEREIANNGELIEHLEKDIDKNEKEIFRVTFDDNRKILEYNHTEYDDNGNMIYRDKLDSFKKLKWSVKIKYDSNNMESERVLYNPSIEKKTVWTTDYVLDNNMNWIKKIMIIDNDTIKTTERKLVYN